MAASTTSSNGVQRPERVTGASMETTEIVSNYTDHVGTDPCGNPVQNLECDEDAAFLPESRVAHGRCVSRRETVLIVALIMSLVSIAALLSFYFLSRRSDLPPSYHNAGLSTEAVVRLKLKDSIANPGSSFLKSVEEQLRQTLKTDTIREIRYDAENNRQSIQFVLLNKDRSAGSREFNYAIEFLQKVRLRAGLSITLPDGVVLPVIGAEVKLISDNTDLCLTSKCTFTSASIINSMDMTINPCEDFYEFSCRNWIAQNPVPDDVGKYSRFTELNDRNSIEMRNLYNDRDFLGHLESLRNIRTLYSSCVDLDAIEKLGADPLKHLLRSFGGYPMVDGPEGWNPNDFDWHELNHKLNLMAQEALIGTAIIPDEKNSTHYIFALDSRRLPLDSPRYYFDPSLRPVREAYVEFGTAVAVLLGANRSYAHSEMEHVLDLEGEVVKFKINETERRDLSKQYNKMSLKEADHLFPNLKLASGVRTLFHEARKNFSLDEPIVIYGKEFFTKLNSWIPLQTATPEGKRRLANFMIWQGIQPTMHALSSAFRDTQLQYSKVVHGIETVSLRWKDCLAWVRDHMGMAAGRLFIERFFSGHSKTDAMEMIDHVKVAFYDSLEHNEWMDDESREYALQKARNMLDLIAYPDWLLTNDTKLDEMYSQPKMNNGDFFENLISNTRHHVMQTLTKLNSKINRAELVSVLGLFWVVGITFEMSPDSVKHKQTPWVRRVLHVLVRPCKWWNTLQPSRVNAFYKSSSNSMVFPAGILQPPFFDPNRLRLILSWALNYGAIGMVIGHEITHGFDDRGRQYDMNGHVKQWWSDATIQRFNHQKQCIINQYGKFVYAEVEKNISGERTQGENIADNGGLRQAYKAYRNWVREQGQEEKRLPGLPYKPDQLFFIGFAQMWCNSMRKQTALHSLARSAHPPGRFRVLGVLSNMDDFARVFQCPAGSKMNPKNKCFVW